MGPRWIAVFATAVLTLGLIPVLDSAAGENQDIYESGFTYWDVNNHNRLYVSGDDSEAKLVRNNPPDSGQFTSFRTAVPVEVFNIETPPLSEGFNTSLNISTYFSAAISSGTSQTCALSNQPINIYTEFLIGGQVVYSGEASGTIRKAGEPGALNLSTQILQVDYAAREGDTMGLRLSVHNECLASITIEWGGVGIRSGGVIMEGVIYQPVFSVRVDEGGIAQVEFTPTLPWGIEDIRSMEFTIWGPLTPSEMSTGDPDYLKQQFNKQQPLNRTDSNGREALVWTGDAILPAGDMILKICIQTVDSHVDLECHAEGLVRFHVDGENEAIASAGVWLGIAGSLAIVAYLVNCVRVGMSLPTPLIGALLVMALLMLPLMSDMPDLGGDVIIADDARVPDFILHKYGNGSVSLDELMDGKEAVVIGISIPASINAYDQIYEFRDAIERIDERASFVQIVTGEDVRMDDLVALNDEVNGNWDILMDDGESRFAQLVPTGVSDAVIIIDRSGHISYFRHGTSSTEEIITAVDAVSDGGQQSIVDVFSLIWGPGLALLLLALPRQGWSKPEEPLPPGSLWGSIVLAGSLGYLMVNILPLLIVFIPIDMDFRQWLEMALYSWFLTAAIRSARGGTPYEVRKVAGLLHSLYPENFQNWRAKDDVERDLLLGFYLGWFTFFAFPAGLSQGVGAVVLTGGFGWIKGPFLLLMHMLMFGLVILIIRFVASWGGPVSRMFGRSGADIFARALGWAMVPLALWVLADRILESMANGFI
ncbi:MAG: hypothetical protein ACKVJ7_04665 [Candidatus Poseidoniales archaeon]|jgi:hypothetical protein|tara:strand:- start:433 stop:2727 length:2295 start_codon:yes stop_codon:yes gene_type:complete